MTDAATLTIVLMLKDRCAFTLRWMTYANSIGFPFRVLIADGGFDQDLPVKLSNTANFPRVDYEYVRYPPDRTYADYYEKMRDAIGRVTTPYVALADNDDFFIVNGLRHAVEFLVANPDYVAAGGQCGQVWVTTGGAEDDTLYGDAVESKCAFEAHSVDAVTARLRMRQQSLSIADPFYYHVKPTAEAQRQFEIMRRLNLNDLFLVEHLFSFLTAIAGKTRRLPELYLVRQRDSPGSSGTAHQEQFGDWLGRMLVPTWSDDFSKFVTVTSTALAAADGLSIEDAKDWVIASHRMFVAPMLLHNLLGEPTIRPAMPLVIHAVRRLVQLGPDSRVRRMARAVYRRLPWLSFDIVQGSEFVTRQVPNADEELRPIRAFLTRMAE